MKIRLAADLQYDSIVDGEGIRAVIWTQGCPHNCFGCHNPDTHDFNDGALIDIEEMKEKISKLKNQDGITFSGGDPMCQSKECSVLAKFSKEIGLNVWCYTGYTFEQLIAMSKVKPEILEFLNNIDVLIDGKFILEERNLDLIFRGSSNQRIIDVQKSLEEKEVCLVEKYYKNDNYNILDHESNYVFV